MSFLPPGRSARLGLPLGPALWGTYGFVALFALGPSPGAVPPALDWRPGTGYRAAALLPPSAPARTGFTRLPSPQTGIAFTNSLHPSVAANNQILENGAGVALGDMDGDGWCDVFLCGSQRPSALFRNLGGWRFEDVTASAGVACSGQFTTGAVFADVDGDGDLDLLVNGIGVGTRLFLNDGLGHFVEDTASGLARTFGATSLTLADIDGDGDLDLYDAALPQRTGGPGFAHPTPRRSAESAWRRRDRPARSRPALGSGSRGSCRFRLLVAGQRRGGPGPACGCRPGVGPLAECANEYLRPAAGHERASPVPGRRRGSAALKAGSAAIRRPARI